MTVEMRRQKKINERFEQLKLDYVPEEHISLYKRLLQVHVGMFIIRQNSQCSVW